MLCFPHSLAEIDSKVFETTDYRRVWFLGNPMLGTEVHKPKGRLDELTGSCYFVIPKLAADEGPLGLLTVARGLPGGPSKLPSFWDSAELKDVKGGVFAQVTYHPRRGQIELGMNVGSGCSELLGVTLDGATPELICGRVLELYFEISEDRIYLSVNDCFAGGDVSLSATAPATGRRKHPWSASPSGNWWVALGFDGRADQSLPLPSGVGFSNLRITLGADNEEAMGSLLYTGALDHLVADPPPRFSEMELERLTRHASTLQEIAADLEQLRLSMPISPSRPSPSAAESCA